MKNDRLGVPNLVRARSIVNMGKMGREEVGLQLRKDRHDASPGTLPALMTAYIVWFWEYQRMFCVFAETPCKVTYE